MRDERNDDRVAALAARQGGQVSTAQLLDLGLSRAAISRRVGRGWLHRGPRGVYGVGHRRTDAVARRWAALLACGPAALLSHVTAAVVWDLLAPRGGPIHVTVPGRGTRRPRAGMVIHRAVLDAADIDEQHGFPVTGPERTLLDLALVVSPKVHAAAVERSEWLRLTRTRELERLTGERRPGAARLGVAIAEPLTVIRSELERRMRALCRRHGIAEPLVNTPVCGFEVDFHWPEVRLVVETDGGEFHRTRRAFEADRRRDVILTTAGLRVVRFTHAQVTREPAVVAAQLKALGAPPSLRTFRSA